jgi:tetratricopeptide (TPR) repeat protein
MKKIAPLALVAAASIAVPAAASVVTMGAGYAESCYLAADAHNASRQAMDACDKALTEEAITPQDRVATYVNRGILFLRRAKIHEANADFDTALKLDPNQAEAWLNKAIAHARFGKPVDALPFVAKALELNTRRPALAYFVRAMGLEDSGNIAGAYRDLKRAQQLEPGWKEPAIELRRFQVSHG